MFLTLGIVLGSAWAYYELGWGGWWFWDPVENASFMPWLAGTALLHSLAVTEQRASFKAWTLLLSICAFSLCLLGTFLVRSGVLVSVHAFASDPARGMFILAFMVLVTGGSLLLFAVRGHRVRSRVNNALWSRESLLLGNNVLLMAAMLVVLLGTLLPLVHKQLGLGSISVGEPFFNTMFTWLMAPFALLLGVGPLVRWGRDRPRKIRNLLLVAFITTLFAVGTFTVAASGPHRRHDGGGHGDGLLDRGAGGGGGRTARLPRHKNAPRLLGHGGGAPRPGGDDYRYRLQPELQRGA
ncbi:cytochrome c-type biogenesis protein F2 [Salmonella enterica subsp. arizonae]|uniref:Cytochrome c-type biogenesis protein F2 n=1 Tax=Salmonella enterica subsp. arizonae TaxID=59203 RepID=A0A379TSV5_SALER|nr:cytochrome c-type biogenesis protein F2 [Salmonella enterica subsp. arizonae]